MLSLKNAKNVHTDRLGLQVSISVFAFPCFVFQEDGEGVGFAGIDRQGFLYGGIHGGVLPTLRDLEGVLYAECSREGWNDCGGMGYTDCKTIVMMV